jgi:capsular polysaccharide transport system permease protein
MTTAPTEQPSIRALPPGMPPPPGWEDPAAQEIIVAEVEVAPPTEPGLETVAQAFDAQAVPSHVSDYAAEEAATTEETYPVASEAPTAEEPPAYVEEPQVSADQGSTTQDAGGVELAPQAESIQTELLPAEEQGEKPRGITLLFMRVLGKKEEEGTDRTLAPRPATGIAPSPYHPGPPRRPGFIRRHALFFFSVLLPTTLAALYFTQYATDIYVSESSYVVRSPNQQPATGAGLGALLQGAGFSGFSKAPDDVYAISEYIRSRDALNYLDERLDLHTAWKSPEIDLFHRFDPLDRDDSREALYEYYLKRVKVGANPASAITTLNISGFTPEQVLEMNKLLLGKAEELVNILNERGRNDLIRFAEKEVQLAEDKAKAAAEALSDFRNTQAVVDPEKQTMLHFEQIARLQEELIRTRGQLTQLKVFAPDSPHPPALELRAQTLEAEIASETEKITGGEKSLASKAADYQRLQLEREFADKQLAVAMSALEGARSEAQRQQLYLETIAKPSLPDDATYPKRLRGIATTFILGLVAWGILAMLLAGVREHQY